jgi:hypothetical protein
MCVKIGPQDGGPEGEEFPGGEWKHTMAFDPKLLRISNDVRAFRVLVTKPDGRADNVTEVDWRRFEKGKLVAQGAFQGKTDVVFHTKDGRVQFEVRPAQTIRLIYEPIAPPEPDTKPAPKKKPRRS